MQRLLGIAFSTLLILALSACGGKENKKDVTTDDTEDHQTQIEEEAPSDAQTGAYVDISALEGTDDPAETDDEKPLSTTPLEAYPLSEVTDDILVLVNKTHPLTSEYKPGDLVTVEHCDLDVGTENTRKLRPVAADAVEELIAAAAEEKGYALLMRTGYRSYDYQDYLFNYWVEKDGEAAADMYSARPGKSEHQTGLACDIGKKGVGLSSFNGTEEAAWLAENAHRFGFILRFPEGKTDITGYNYESWHFRYVGKEAAEIIYDQGLTLEEYLDILD